jgi:hypothetical protein
MHDPDKNNVAEASVTSCNFFIGLNLKKKISWCVNSNNHFFLSLKTIAMMVGKSSVENECLFEPLK